MDPSQPSIPPTATYEDALTDVQGETVGNPSEPAPTLSKNAQKRMLKAQRREEFKHERRAKEKAAKAAKKAAKREQEAKSVSAQEEEGDSEEVGGDGDGKRATKKRKLGDGEALAVHNGEGSSASANISGKKSVPQKRKEPFGAKIVIDLGFDDKMTEREIISMVSQCAYCYSSNRKSSNPFSTMLFTSLNGRTKARLDMLGTYQNWKGVEWWEGGYDALWEPSQAREAPEDSETIEGKDYPAEGEFMCPVTKTVQRRTKTSKETVVYLTADSDVELLELNPEDTYIIGGIVDKNRYKALCENKARAQSIRTARLPIGVFLKELPTRKVLTVNQVLDILLNWIEHRDWRKALFDVMPQRKFDAVGKNARRRQQKTECEGEMVGDGEDEEMDETVEMSAMDKSERATQLEVEGVQSEATLSLSLAP